MKKNPNYEKNMLQAFASSYLHDGVPIFTLGKRRHVREDGTFKSAKGLEFSAELTKITNESIEERNSFLLKQQGVGEAYTAHSYVEAIKAINKKNSKYSDKSTRILILDANTCVPFDWNDYWQPAIEYGQKTDFAGVYAIETSDNGVKILTLKEVKFH